MNRPTFFLSKSELAEAAALDAIATLQLAIANHGNAVWVLAGGTTPELAYSYIAKFCLSELDWEKITFVIGDERIGPLDGPDNNWNSIEQVLLHSITQATFIRPPSDLSAEVAANKYSEQLSKLSKTKNGVPRFDLVWLGMGDDGHTLSLFPSHPDFKVGDNRLCTSIHNSPKHPSDRISLTLHGLSGAQHTCILVSGQRKAAAFNDAQNPNSKLPIAQAARLTNAVWFSDIANS